MSNLAFRLAGLALFAIGAIGLVVPVWPTTIFWILAALAFARSWPAMRDRIYGWPRLGPVIRDFVDHGVLSRKGKHHAVLGMLVGLLIAVVVKPTLSVALWSALLVGFGAAYVLTRPERAEQRE